MGDSRTTVESLDVETVEKPSVSTPSKSNRPLRSRRRKTRGGLTPREKKLFIGWPIAHFKRRKFRAKTFTDRARAILDRFVAEPTNTANLPANYEARRRQILGSLHSICKVEMKGHGRSMYKKDVVAWLKREPYAQWLTGTLNVPVDIAEGPNDAPQENAASNLRLHSADDITEGQNVAAQENVASNLNLHDPAPDAVEVEDVAPQEPFVPTSNVHSPTAFAIAIEIENENVTPPYLAPILIGNMDEDEELSLIFGLGYDFNFNMIPEGEE